MHVYTEITYTEVSEVYPHKTEYKVCECIIPLAMHDLLFMEIAILRNIGTTTYMGKEFPHRDRELLCCSFSFSGFNLIVLRMDDPMCSV